MKKFIYSNLYFFVVFFHFLVVIYILVLLPLFVFGILKINHWIMTILFILYVFSLIFFHKKCSLTLLQNKIAIRIGRPIINAFFAHYLAKPLKIEATNQLRKLMRILHVLWLVIMVVLYLAIDVF